MTDEVDVFGLIDVALMSAESARKSLVAAQKSGDPHQRLGYLVVARAKAQKASDYLSDLDDELTAKLK